MNKVRLSPDVVCHMYNHANGRENLFVNPGNYHYFLERYLEFIHPIAATYAYCLMPNHFHFLIRVKSKSELLDHYKDSGLITKAAEEDQFPFEKRISKTFSNFFSAYTQALNIQQKRSGSLFTPNFKRKEVNNREYFKRLIHYIHYNPVHHGFVKKPGEWPYSTYNTILSEKATKICRNTVLDVFDGHKEFINAHSVTPDQKLLLELPY